MIQYKIILFALIFLLPQVALAEELRLAVLEFKSVGTSDSSLLFQLSDEARGGALDVFPASTSKFSVLTRENILDVLARDGKDKSCLTETCALTLGKNIGARFVLVGELSQVESMLSLRLSIYDTKSNDLLGQKTIREASNMGLLGITRKQSASLIEKTLGSFDEGRKGRRKLGGKKTWTVEPSDKVVLEIVEELEDGFLDVDGERRCTSLPCSVHVKKGQRAIHVGGTDCTSWKETISVTESKRLETNLVCSFGFVSLSEKSGQLYIDEEPVDIAKVHRVSTGKHLIKWESECFDTVEREVLVVDRETFLFAPEQKSKRRNITLSALYDTGEQIVADVYMNGELIGKTDDEITIPNCTLSLEVGHDGVRKSIDLNMGADSYTATFEFIRSLIQKDGYDAVLIPEGQWTIGCIRSDGACYRSEESNETVVFPYKFYMMKSEVTQKLYQRVMGENPSHFRKCGTDCPVEKISWYDSVRMANALSAQEGLEECYRIGNGRHPVVSLVDKDCNGWRLPTSEEWEYAGRGNEKLPFAGSKLMEEVGWYSKNSENRTHSVCSKKTNGFGLCDMSGNVREWVWNTREKQRRTLYQGDRGGCFLSIDNHSRVTYQGKANPRARVMNRGVRLMRIVQYTSP